jgi:peptidoglycan biosynthesis protein MviN/MurJ (putative lipid II flippase)
VAIFVPRTSPAGSASLLPWIAFAPVAVFFGLTAYCAAPLLHYERYVWPALRGAAATIVGLILTLVVVALGGGVVWIGLAVSAGYGVALLLLMFEIVAIGRLAVFAPPTRWAIREVRSLWPKLSASAASGVIGGQVFVLIERIFTAPLGVGAVASISYARGVAYTPAILGQAIGAGVYPSVLRAHAAEAIDFVRDRFVSGLRLTLFVTAVSGAYLALYSAEITDVLFGRDAVSPSSLLDVQHCLLAFSLALLGWMLTIYASRLFGALNLFRGLVLQELVALVVYLAIVFPLRSALGVPGVALAFGIGQVVGGLAATILIARKLEIRLAAIAGRAVLPAALRATPVVLALIVVKVVGVASDMPSIVVAGAGALTAAVIAAAILWPVDWPELDSVRGFVRRHVGVAAARE